MALGQISSEFHVFKWSWPIRPLEKMREIADLGKTSQWGKQVSGENEGTWQIWEKPDIQENRDTGKHRGKQQLQERRDIGEFRPHIRRQMSVYIRSHITIHMCGHIKAHSN